MNKVRGQKAWEMLKKNGRGSEILYKDVREMCVVCTVWAVVGGRAARGGKMMLKYWSLRRD